MIVQRNHGFVPSNGSLRSMFQRPRGYLASAAGKRPLPLAELVGRRAERLGPNFNKVFDLSAFLGLAAKPLDAVTLKQRKTLSLAKILDLSHFSAEVVSSEKASTFFVEAIVRLPWGDRSFAMAWYAFRNNESGRMLQGPRFCLTGSLLETFEALHFYRPAVRVGLGFKACRVEPSPHQLKTRRLVEEDFAFVLKSEVITIDDESNTERRRILVQMWSGKYWHLEYSANDKYFSGLKFTRGTYLNLCRHFRENG